MEYFKNLPVVITLDILSRVPTESVLECKSVCKTWNDLVSRHPSFSKMHFHHHLNYPSDSGKLGFLALTYNKNIPKFQYFEYRIENHDQSTTPIEKITRVNITTPFTGVISFLGSCNGLVCFARCRSSVEQRHGHGPVCICNPITKEYVMLPEIKTDCCDNNVSRQTAFGYVSSTNEYKVMGILSKPEFIEVYIYTLGSGSGWRNLGKFNFGFSAYHAEQGIFANGALYWMSSQLGMILAFDLSEEIFSENLSPPPLPQYNTFWPYNKIGVLDGFLFFAGLLASEREHCHDIWLLRKRNDNHDDMREQEEHQSWVWSKEFRFDDSELLAVTKSDSVLTFKNFKISIYDTITSNSETLVEFKERFRRVYPHKNTLVSLKELGEEDTKIMESVEGDRKL